MIAVLIDNDGFMAAAYRNAGHIVIVSYNYDGTLKEIEIN
jgi:predicted GNAT superfamily acetyltransferase